MYKLVCNTQITQDSFRDELRLIEGFYVSASGEVYSVLTYHRLSQQIRRRYYSITRGNTTYRVHRLIAKAFPEICGEWFEGAVVDHINGNCLDNRAVNLRVCTSKENSNNPITLERMRRPKNKTKNRLQD